ncbi:MAG: glucokinase [Acidimicrobiales bacterium]|jgi:glucokinase
MSNRVSVPTPDEAPEPTVLVELIEQARGVLSAHDVSGAVVGVPGVVDHDSEQLMTGVNLPAGWAETINESWLGERTGLAVSLANDADLAAVGEARFGAGLGATDVVYVTISTGVGAGILLDGRLMRGRYSAGEIGHTVVDRGLALRGQDGTVEGIGSGTAIGRAMATAGRSGGGAELATAVRAGDEAAIVLWNEAIDAVALGVVNLCWLVAPEVVVIGGGVGMNGDLVLPRIERQMAVRGPKVRQTRICNASLGDAAGLVGAAGWWHAIGRA